MACSACATAGRRGRHAAALGQEILTTRFARMHKFRRPISLRFTARLPGASRIAALRMTDNISFLLSFISYLFSFSSPLAPAACALLPAYFRACGAAHRCAVRRVPEVRPYGSQQRLKPEANS